MTVILYTRRNVGMIALSWFVAKGYSVRVITDDINVKWLAYTLGQQIVSFDTMGGYDFFASVHGWKVVPKKHLKEGVSFNVHPCLGKYPGHDPIRKYIMNQDTEASVESHFMTNEVDKGEVIAQEFFTTPICETYADFYNEAFCSYYKILEATMEKLLK